MEALRKKFESSPLLARVVPFVVFVILTACQGQFGEASRYWIYFTKTVVGAWLVWVVWPLVKEMRWAFSWEAVVTGVGVFAIWVGLNDLYPKWGKAGTPWNPCVQFGDGTALAWFFIAVRILGSAIVVPPIEEIFYRSFLYRYIVKPDFQSVPMGIFHPLAFVVTAAIFGVAHYEWLAGVLCAFAYQGLVIYKKRLGDAMTAHAITNFLLGIWVVWKGAWQFW
jgi:CAAX prenyl protease-like protein